MAKKDEILGKNQDVQYYDLSDEEKTEVASLIALIEQSRMAQDFLYSRIVQNIAGRYELIDKDITLNFQEIMDKGVKEARLVVK